MCSDTFTVHRWTNESKSKCKLRTTTTIQTFAFETLPIFFVLFSGTLEGLKGKPSYEKLLEEPLLRFSGLYLEECPALMVRLQVYSNGEPLGLAVNTSYKAFTKRSK